MKNEKIEAFAENVPGIEVVLQEHSRFRIPLPEIGVKYDTHCLAGEPTRDLLQGRGQISLINTISTPSCFKRINGSGISIVLLRGGYRRIDLIGMICESLCFQPSLIFDNALDIQVDSAIRDGCVFIENVKSGMIIYHPVLAQALKYQAAIGPLDLDEGIYYAACQFYYDPDAGERLFIDASKANGMSILKLNSDFFSTDDI